MRRAERLRVGLLVALGLGVAWAIAYRGGFDAAALERWVQAAGLGAPVVFMIIYAAATVLFLPGSVLTLAGGVLFGPLWGTFYNLTGATLGATLAFLIARYLASEPVARWMEDKAGSRLKRLIEGVEAEGWRFVAFVRLVPLFPFNLLNYALGLTRIRVAHYVMATYLFMLPGAVAYTYLGYAGREAVAGSEGAIRAGLLVLALLALVALLPRLASRLRAPPMITTDQLGARLAAGEPLLLLDVRGPEEYVGELGHIAGARNIPLQELPQRLAELQVHSETPVAIVCRTDKRSAKAAQVVRQAGFARVEVVRGGMEQWNREGREAAR